MRIIDRFSKEHTSFVAQLEGPEAACADGAPASSLIR